MDTFAFLHGGGQGSWVWEPTLSALAGQTSGDAKAISLDIPGCGEKRGMDTAGLGPDEVAAILASDIAESGLGEVVLVGHSQAGGILPRIARLRPDLVRRLVYVTCSVPSQGQTVLQMMGAGLHGSVENEVGWPFDPKTCDIGDRYPTLFCNDMDAPEASVFLAQLGKDAWPKLTYEASHWPLDHLAGIPSTYVACLRDAVLPLSWQEKFAARFNTGKTVRIDAGHQVMISRPHALAEILLIEANAPLS